MQLANTFTCEQCRNDYTPRQTEQRFCSQKCRHTFHNNERLAAIRYLRANKPFDVDAVFEKLKGLKQ